MTIIGPLSPATVHIVLEYICPLSATLPPHIISTPLGQRHHFLALSPDSPVDYLAWPSPNQSLAVNLLQSLPMPSHDLLFPIQYTADPENISAHARISAEIRLVFLWNIEGWQYHNVALMPFPPDSYVSLTDATALYSSDDFLPEQRPTNNFADNDDPTYWDSYGHGEVSHHISRTSLVPQPSSEDAYWAQYSSARESGGSSPWSRKKASISDPIPERIFVPSDDLQIHHVEPYNPLEPPSPEALTRRLAALTVGHGATSPLLLDGSPITDSGISSSAIGEVSHPQSSSPSVMQQRSDKPIIRHQRDSDDRAQDALRDSVRSLYQFWKLSGPDRLSDEAKTLFLSTVYQVIDQL